MRALRTGNTRAQGRLKKREQWGDRNEEEVGGRSGQGRDVADEILERIVFLHGSLWPPRSGAGISP